MLEDLIVRTLIFGSITAIAGWRVNRMWLGGATLFWIAWLFLILSAYLGSVSSVPRLIPDSSFEVVGEAYWGAFVGGLVGIFVAGPSGARVLESPAWYGLLDVSAWILRKATKPFVVLMLLLGGVHFAQRWALVDFDITRLWELRAISVTEAWLWSARLASYVVMGGMLLIVALATVDATRGVSWRRLGLLWLSYLPQGLAFGGRGWTLAPLLTYFFALMLSRACTRQPVPIRRLYPLLAMCGLGLWAFTVIGIIRQAEDRSGRSAAAISDWDEGERLMAVTWVGSSLASAGVHSEYAAGLGPAWGQATLDYLSRKLSDIDLLDYKVLEWDSWRMTELSRMGQYGYTWCVPPTAIPYLILDYGRAGMPWALGILLAVLHWLTVRWVGQGVFRHVVAFLAYNAIFNSIQLLAVGTALNVVALFWALVASGLARAMLGGQRSGYHVPVIKSTWRGQ